MFDLSTINVFFRIRSILLGKRPCFFRHTPVTTQLDSVVFTPDIYGFNGMFSGGQQIYESIETFVDRKIISPVFAHIRITGVIVPTFVHVHESLKPRRRALMRLQRYRKISGRPKIKNTTVFFALFCFEEFSLFFLY